MAENNSNAWFGGFQAQPPPESAEKQEDDGFDDFFDAGETKDAPAEKAASSPAGNNIEQPVSPPPPAEDNKAEVLPSPSSVAKKEPEIPVAAEIEQNKQEEPGHEHSDEKVDKEATVPTEVKKIIEDIVSSAISSPTVPQEEEKKIASPLPPAEEVPNAAVTAPAKVPVSESGENQKPEGQSPEESEENNRAKHYNAGIKAQMAAEALSDSSKEQTLEFVAPSETGGEENGKPAAEEEKHKDEEDDGFDDFQDTKDAPKPLELNASPQHDREVPAPAEKPQEEQAAAPKLKEDNEDEDDFGDFAEADNHPETAPVEPEKEDKKENQNSRPLANTTTEPPPVPDWTLKSKPTKPTPSSLLSVYPSMEAFTKELRKTLTQLCPTYSKSDDTDDFNSNISSSNVSDAPEKQPGDSKIETVLGRLRKPLFDVGAKSVGLRSLRSVQAYLVGPVREAVPQRCVRGEYRPPRRIGEGDGVAVGLDSSVGMPESAETISPLEEQLVNVLGYMQTSWKNTAGSVVKPQDRQSIASNSKRSVRGLSRDEEEDFKEKQPELTGIAKDLAGLDMISAGNKDPKRMDSQIDQVTPTSGKTKEPEKKVESPKKLSKEQVEAAAKAEKRKKMIDEIMGKMPDLGFLLANTVVAKPMAKATGD